MAQMPVPVPVYKTLRLASSLAVCDTTSYDKGYTCGTPGGLMVDLCMVTLMRVQATPDHD